MGYGVAVDTRKAVKLYTQAADAGDTTAQYNLGKCYRRGIGVDVDKDEAVKWSTLSAEGGFGDAQLLLDDQSNRPALPSRQWCCCRH